MKTYIGLLLHAYQPPTQSREVLDRIFRESYEPVIALLERKEGNILSIDLAKSLGEQLPADFLERVKQLRETKRIELVNTSAYHYLLPLVPAATINRQLELNTEFFKTVFGNAPVSGIWPPEMAIEERVISYIGSAGYSWVLADDFPIEYARRHLAEPLRVPNDWIPLVHGCGVLPRSRLWSGYVSWGRYPRGDQFLKDLIEGQRVWRKSLGRGTESYIVLAVDFETFGHHLPGSVEQFLAPFLKEIEQNSDKCALVPLDEIFNKFPKIELESGINPGSWSTQREDLEAYIPYPLWKHPRNEFHIAWNEFMGLALTATPAMPSPELEGLLDKSFYSCTPWQISSGYGNKTIARWALPFFERIMTLLPEEREKLSHSYRIMDELTR